MMDLWSIYKELELLAAVHGWETEVVSGESTLGDRIFDVSYDEPHKCIVIGG